MVGWDLSGKPGRERPKLNSSSVEGKRKKVPAAGLICMRGGRARERGKQRKSAELQGGRGPFACQIPMPRPVLAAGLGCVIIFLPAIARSRPPYQKDLSPACLPARLGPDSCTRSTGGASENHDSELGLLFIMLVGRRSCCVWISSLWRQN